MTTEFNTFGFNDLRNYIQQNWNHVAVVDTNGDEVLRWSVDDNPNTTWQTASDANPLIATLTVTGQDVQDAGNALPVTLSSTKTYKSDSASTATTQDSMKDISVQALNDEVYITHNYTIPV